MLIENQSQHGLREGLTERNRNKLPFSRNSHCKVSVSLEVYERSSWPRIGTKCQPLFILSPGICPHSLQHNGYTWYFLTCARILLIRSVASDRSIHDVLWKVNEICPPERLRNCCPSAVSYLLSRAISFSKQGVGRNSFPSCGRRRYKLTIHGQIYNRDLVPKDTNWKLTLTGFKSTKFLPAPLGL